MHAAERYEGMVDKLRECSEHLEGTKEAARDLAVRFEEVKKHRQQLFQVRPLFFLLFIKSIMSGFQLMLGETVKYELHSYLFCFCP